MATKRSFQITFEELRAILARHATRLIVVVDKPGDYQVASPSTMDRIGRPLSPAFRSRRTTSATT